MEYGYGVRANEQAIQRLREIDRAIGELAEQLDQLEMAVEDNEEDARAHRVDEAEARRDAERAEAAAQDARRRLAELQPESARLEGEIERILKSLPDDETARQVIDAVGFENF